MGTWDRGVKYDDLKRRLIRLIKVNSRPEDRKTALRLGYLVAYAIQLRNGLRISEALEAFEKFKKYDFEKDEGKRVATVRVRKKKREDYREAVWPDWVSWSVMDVMRRFNVELKKSSAAVLAPKLLGVNTHTLRYARITYLTEKGYSPALVAKITHHSNLNFIVRYTQEKLAKRTNLEIE